MKYAYTGQNSKDPFKHQDQTCRDWQNPGSLSVNLRMKGIDHGSEQKTQNVKRFVSVLNLGVQRRKRNDKALKGTFPFPCPCPNSREKGRRYREIP